MTNVKKSMYGIFYYLLITHLACLSQNIFAYNSSIAHLYIYNQDSNVGASNRQCYFEPLPNECIFKFPSISEWVIPYRLTHKKLNEFTAENFREWATYNNLNEKEIFEQYALYTYPQYRSFLRSQPNYAVAIKKIHQKIGGYDWLDKLCALAKRQYVRGLKKLIAQEMVFIEKQDQYQGLKKAKEQARISSLAKQQAVYYEQLNSLLDNTSLQHQTGLQELHKQWSNQKTDMRLQRRAHDIELALNSADTYYNKEYMPILSCQLFLPHRDEIYQELKECYGNSIQQTLHQEFFQITKEYTHYQGELPHYAHIIVPDALLLGLQASKAGHIKEASALADLCWTLLEWTTSAAQGVIIGVENTVDMALHPIQSITQSINSVVTTAHLLSTMVFSATQLAHYYVTDNAQFYVQRAQIADYLTNTLNATADYLRNAPTSEHIKKGTAFFTQAALFHGMCRLVHTGCTQLAESLPAILKEAQLAKDSTQLIAIGVPGLKIPGVQLMEKSLATATNRCLKVSNMKEFFKTDFGKILVNYVEKTKHVIQGQPVYRVVKKFKHPNIKKGDYFYLDGMHKNHLEFFNADKTCNIVLNLDGINNSKKLLVQS